VVLVGARKDSETYVRSKKKGCEETGIASFGTDLPDNVTEDELLEVFTISFQISVYIGTAPTGNPPDDPTRRASHCGNWVFPYERCLGHMLAGAVEKSSA
jgi:hypothetical protein